MKSTLFWVIVVLIIIVGVFWFMGRDAEGPTAPQDGTEAQTMVVSLSAQNDSGMSGMATLTDMNGSTLVTLDLAGAPEGQAQPAHIHTGSCADIGGVEYPLESPVNGMSETMLSVSLHTLVSELPLAINVHKSPEESEIYVACGDLVQ